MENKITYRYSWTRKTADGSYHKVEGDTVDEVMNGMDELEERIQSRLSEEKPVESQPERAETRSEVPLTERYEGKTLGEIEEDLDPSWCEVHKVKMKERTGKNGTFYSHARDLGNNNWDYCSGSGWRSEK